MTTATERDTYTFALRALADVIDVDNLPPPLSVSPGDVGLTVQVAYADWPEWVTLADAATLVQTGLGDGSVCMTVEAAMNRGLPFQLVACVGSAVVEAS